MVKDKLEKDHNCDNINCNHNNTEGLCCMFNPDVCKYRQLRKENDELEKACDETQELLDKQIEATLKLDKENTELKKEVELWKKASEDNSYKAFQLQEENKLLTKRNLELKDGAEFGYNKANEWHFMKDGDLPEHEVNVLVLYNVQCIDIAHYNYDYKEWHFADSIVRDVIAWKEIVLPELKES